jgi:hypothetical protein
MDPVMDGTGTLIGQRLSLGLDGARAVQVQALPAESFAAGPFGGLVVVGRDDGTSSTVQAIDVGAGCAWPLATETAVIRRATIDPVGRTLYETRVDRSTRADLGVWARPLDGSPARRVMDPITPDPRFGITFSTELAWEPSGSVLAIQSCGLEACRTRFHSPSGSETPTVDDPDLGAMIGVTAGQLVSYLACSASPCSIVAVDLASHARRTLAEQAGIAIMTDGPGGPRLVHEVFAGTGVLLRSVATDGSAVADLGPIPDGLRLVATPDRAGAATRLPAGWALVAVDGRIALDGPSRHSQLRHVPDGLSTRFEEVMP